MYNIFYLNIFSFGVLQEIYDYVPTYYGVIMLICEKEPRSIIRISL